MSPLSTSDAVVVYPRCTKPAVYFALRRMGFAWWTCVRVMWLGADMTIEECE